MAVTKIHPIKSTLKKSIDYICNGDKTGDEIYVSTHLCSRENAYKEFEMTKKEFGSKTKTLGHHLIQSFQPGEVSHEEAHQVGLELCERVLDGKYEYVLATHIDKGHIHNHIIFNSVDVDKGKVYHSYYGSYMNIRSQSDKLCKEHNLSVIDNETKREINEIKKRKFVNWYDWNEDKKGSSYKSRLQFNIDRAIKKSKSWEDFLEIMSSYDYEIKHGKHIAFKGKEQQKFTRTRSISEAYTEESIKDRIANKAKDIGNIIDIKESDNKGLEHWKIKQNLQTASKTVVELRNNGFKSMAELEQRLKKITYDKNEMRKKFEKLSFEQKRIKEVVNHLQICVSKKAHYDGYMKNPNDKIYMMMNGKDIESYKKSFEEIDVFIRQFPHLKDGIIKSLEGDNPNKVFKLLNIHAIELANKQNAIANEHNKVASDYARLSKLKDNMDRYIKADKGEEKRQSVIESLRKAERDVERSKIKRKDKGIER